MWNRYLNKGKIISRTLLYSPTINIMPHIYIILWGGGDNLLCNMNLRVLNILAVHILDICCCKVTGGRSKKWEKKILFWLTKFKHFMQVWNKLTKLNTYSIPLPVGISYSIKQLGYPKIFSSWDILKHLALGIS